MKFAANLSLLWSDLPYLDRFSAAADAGFEAVEVLFPYEIAAKETQRALLTHGQRMVLINAPPPNYTGGARGFAAVPDLAGRFQYDLRRALRYVEVLKVPMLHIMSGEAEGARAKETLIENLTWAAKAAPKGVTLTIEPLCPETQPGYFLQDYALAAEVIEAVAAPNVGLQYDSFHAAMLHGDAVEVFETYAPLIKHIQIGDAPNRGTPGTGRIPFQELFARIDASDYTGWISAEYLVEGRTEDTLRWMPS
ncbi:MAG: TIM barrel protein [Pseudomonadota bacterium]